MSIEQSRTPSLPEVLERVVQEELDDFFVALPGKIESYNAVTQTAKVLPLLSRAVIFPDGEETLDEIPDLFDVPVVFPRGGGYFLTFPLEKGDNVLLIICDRSIDSFSVSSGGQQLDPVDLRKHDISDAVAIPGFFPTPKAIKEAVGSGSIWGKERDTQIHITDSGVVEVRGANLVPASSYVALATAVAAELVKIQTALNTHVHDMSGYLVQTPPVPGQLSGVAASSYIPGSVAATKLKSD